MGDSPERHEKVREYGILNRSNERLGQIIQDEKMTTEKALHEMDRMIRNQ